MKKLLFISLCLLHMPADLTSSDVQTIQDTKDGIARFALLASLGMMYVGGKIGYEIGNCYGGSIGRELDDLELLEKLEVLLQYEKKYGKEALEKQLQDDCERVAKRMHPMTGILLLCVCPPLGFLAILSDIFTSRGRLPDLHKHEKEYARDYGDGGNLIGGATGFFGTLLLGAYLAGKV